MNRMFRILVIVMGCLAISGCYSAEYKEGLAYGQDLRANSQLTKASGRKVGDSTFALWFRKMNEQQVEAFLKTNDRDVTLPPAGTPARTNWVKGFKDAMK